MAYNSLKAYRIWRRKKETEEQKFRDIGVDENIIAELHDFDRIAFNSDDRYYKRLCDVGDFYEEIITDESQQEIVSVEQLLDEVENPAMYKILKKANEKTLQIILMRVRGYTVADISKILHISKTAVYDRIKTVREKLKDVR
ncbi:MAG: helix-turn-helix domain-containing protein [Ruminococcus sp.]|nr:helix-turn-helix domain-containing protein [Ruminococcus sp.]MCM1382720.1 helix-turn-helix domain-containing protein [Muribaculaceae bacterium]